MKVEFKFEPLQHVTVLPGLLNYRGRIEKCKVDSGPLNSYSVCVVAEGKTQIIDFYEDEIVAYDPYAQQVY